MASTISHEMVRPLSLLAVNKEYLWTRLGCDSPDADEKVKRSLDEIELARTHMERLWHNCVDLFACMHREVKPRREPVDLCEMLRVLQQEGESIQRVSGVRLVVSLPKTPFCVITDGAMAERILLNLLSNALQLSEPGKEILLAMAQSPGGGACLSVQDQCGGMSDRMIHTLCGQSELTAEEPGWLYSGIGLHLCREMCILLEWTPEVQTDSQGTRILLHIPAHRVEPDRQLLFRSGMQDAEITRREHLATARLELGSVLGLEEYWNK